MSAQNLKVEYDAIIKLRTLDVNTSQAFKNKVDEELKKPQKEILYFFDGDTFFKNILKEDITIDGDKKKVDEYTTMRKKESFSFPKIKIYHKRGDKGFYQYQKMGDEEFYHYSIPKFEKIDYKDEVEYIEKYKCKLAELLTDKGQIIKVWYTEDIPTSAGPFVYNNLPGLVLKVETATQLVYATKISNNATKEDFESINPKLKVLNDDEFFKKKEEYIEESKKVKKTEKDVHL